jgi:hypothetical protein
MLIDTLACIWMAFPQQKYPEHTHEYPVQMLHCGVIRSEPLNSLDVLQDVVD